MSQHFSQASEQSTNQAAVQFHSITSTSTSIVESYQTQSTSALSSSVPSSSLSSTLSSLSFSVAESRESRDLTEKSFCQSPRFSAVQPSHSTDSPTQPLIALHHNSTRNSSTRHYSSTARADSPPSTVHTSSLEEETCCFATQMSCIICCFGCLSMCGCKNTLCQKIVYFPPKPMYEIEEKEGKQIMWIVEEGQKIEPYWSPNFKVEFIKTKNKRKICTMWIQCPGATTSVLFSHGNATDLGCMRDHLVDFSKQLKVNVFAYDYTGYGLSDNYGKPTISDTFADGEAAYEHMLKSYPDKCKRIIIYGQSLGSGITSHLSRCKKVSGIVFHAGLMSGLRVIRNVSRTWWFDIYPNVESIKQSTAPTFVMHGTDDEEIPIHHGIGLSEAAPNPYKPWFVDGAGHNNIEVNFREEMFRKLAQFVQFVENTEPTLDNTPEPGQPRQTVQGKTVYPYDPKTKTGGPDPLKPPPLMPERKKDNKKSSNEKKQEEAEFTSIMSNNEKR